MTDQPDDVAYFAPLDESECLALLRTADVGRVAWAAAEGITVMPVNFRVDGRTVVFHTGAGSPLAALLETTVVGFQVDEIDPESRIGWTVLVRGTTGAADPAAESVSWVPDGRDVGIAITPTSFGGRVVSGRGSEA